MLKSVGRGSPSVRASVMTKMERNPHHQVPEYLGWTQPFFSSVIEAWKLSSRCKLQLTFETLVLRYGWIDSTAISPEVTIGAALWNTVLTLARGWLSLCRLVTSEASTA